MGAGVGEGVGKEEGEGDEQTGEQAGRQGRQIDERTDVLPVCIAHSDSLENSAWGVLWRKTEYRSLVSELIQFVAHRHPLLLIGYVRCANTARQQGTVSVQYLEP